MSVGLFHAQTPYHVLTACAISASRGGKYTDYLVVSPGFPNADALLDAIRKWPGSPFKSVQALWSIYGRNKYIRRIISKVRNQRLRSLLTNYNPDELFVFNTANPTSQALLHYGREQTPPLETVYVEDGMDAYNNGRERTRQSETTYKLERLFFGDWYQRVSIMGDSDRIDRVLVNFPEHARPVLQEKPISKIDFDPFLAGDNRPWISEYLQALDGSLPEQLDAVVLLAHSNAITGDWYEQLIRTALETFQERGDSVGIKYHPRESDPGFIDVPEGNITVLPSAAPVEVIYLLYRNQLRHVVGGISTGLLTALIFLKNPNVISLASQFGDGYSEISTQLSPFNICLIDGKRELRDVLSTVNTDS